MDEPNKKAGNLVLKKVFSMKTGIVVCIIGCIIIGIYVFNSKKKEETIQPEFSAVNQICELATLKCYYHDVAEYEKQPDGLLQNLFFKYGYKKFWIEYDGIIEVGIDASRVQVNQPDANGLVKLYVPEAEILNVDADLTSMKKPVSDTGIFTGITANEQSEAFSAAQATMKNNAQNDTSILKQAHDNAKELLKQYVIRVGEQMGQTFTVEWISESAGKNI